MIIKPMIRNNVCLNSHPGGCARVVRRQIAYIRNNPGGMVPGKGKPRLVLVIGCSTGYGLASRIAAALGYGAATVGISLEKPGSAAKPGTPGWYNNLCFEAEAARAGIPAKTLDGDAFSDALKERTIAAIRESGNALAGPAGMPPPKIDLIVYSLASPVRTDPLDGVMYRSVIKPIGAPYSGRTVDMFSGKLSTGSVEPATDAEIAATVKVMGGEDWERWIDILAEADLLSPETRTVAYTYLGPSLSWAIYKNGTIGRAKEDLERAAGAINEKLTRALGKDQGRFAWVSVNKALVTRASAVIPIIPFYVSCLFKVMKEKGLHEGCIEQILRLYRDRLYREDGGGVPTDSEGRIRLDDWEMREDVQREVMERMEQAKDENIALLADVEGFRHDFLEVHGFDVPGIDYEAGIDPSGILPEDPVERQE
ncbi:MAG: trans-2-enoyl-CoA reductase family protein [Spirochaetaceae bacterium]|jgi:enoyl-[acyl-carrier protein] reductase/trans-2-enoyl-CoA reductase (NAD+)|nr:trans-2-enoyl-CoA reductase family protein [Spirochaetaceae bacterium]